MAEVGKIYSAMAGVMGDMVAIAKDKRNQQQGFSYRGIDDAYNALQPIMAKHGVFNTPEVLEKWREERTNAKGTILAFTVLRMKYTFWADDGSSVSCIVEGEGMDSGDKSSNKAMAIAHKYALIQTFCVPTEMDDPDAQVHEVVAKSVPDEETIASVLSHIETLTSEDQVRAYYPKAKASLKIIGKGPLQDRLEAACKKRIATIQIENEKKAVAD